MLDLAIAAAATKAVLMLLNQAIQLMPRDSKFAEMLGGFCRARLYDVINPWKNIVCLPALSAMPYILQTVGDTHLHNTSRNSNQLQTQTLCQQPPCAGC